ncbi:MAG: Ty1/Copia family ribonuclease HI, partial [bacterium]
MNPRQGHLEAVYHIYAYLKRHERCAMVFDDKTLQFAKADFPEFDWLDFYGDVTETIPPNAPELRGNPVQMTAFCDADHAGNLVTRRSHTGILIYLNQAPITWYSKAQMTVETSTFGSEFVALRIAVELIESL